MVDLITLKIIILKAKINIDDYGEMLHDIQKDALHYFVDHMDPHTGLVADKSEAGSVASIAATGIGISCLVCGVENGWISRGAAVEKILVTLNFFINSEQSRDKDATGYKGFYYHFLDMKTGRRACRSELSTIDTAILIAGILSATHYFTKDSVNEKAIAKLSKALYERVDWNWATNGKDFVCHGWKPGSGFLKYYWDKGYSEAHILYILALGAPAFPIKSFCYTNWVHSFEVRELYDRKYIHAGPLFIHQMSQLWLHFEGIKDKLNEDLGFDYFENSRKATSIQQCYAIDNPKGFKGYHALSWGITASDGPGPGTRTIDGRKIRFYHYKARGIPEGPDDGTLSPWAVLASLPFAPDLVKETIAMEINNLGLYDAKGRGLYASYNPSWPGKNGNLAGWLSPLHFGINHGPIIMMIENYNTGLIWALMKKCPAIIEGLKKAGFTGGWLAEEKIP